MAPKHEELFRSGKLTDSRDAVMEAIRNKPADESLRVFLFHVSALLGDWKRADTQLDVVRGLSADSAFLHAVFKPIIVLEKFREEVFTGKRTPLAFGEPPTWLTDMISALSIEGEAADQLRATALEAAPAQSGSINGNDFEWVMDADSRLGPTLEIFQNGKYFWLPFEHISHWASEAPETLRDLIWQPMSITLVNGGEIHAHVPVRYPGSHAHDDELIKLGRKTDWSDGNIGWGSRLLATNDADYSLLEIRELKFDS